MLKRVLFLVLITSGLFAQVEKQEVFTGCASDVLMNRDLTLKKGQAILDNKAYDHLIAQYASGQRGINSIYTIPVVVHIIHNGGPENISDAQVHAAIAHFNANFAESNNNQIQFCLAQRDPAGNSTTGITRNVSALTVETMEVNDIALKDINRWAPTCYLNIWIVQEILSAGMGPSVVGYAYFPSAHGQNMDGIVIEAGFFGSSAANDAVGTHEIGHYLGLYHTFENGCTNTDCLQDGDRVCDTPPDQTTFASCNPPSNSCSTDADDVSANNPFTTDVPDLGEDYMDYSNISCYNQFTPGQYSRMEYFLTNVRYSLFNCLSCASPCPNPIVANITAPGAISNVTVGTSLNFSATSANAVSNQWYLVPSSILGTGSSISYTFNTAGTYWMKFKAISGDPSNCLDDIDSVKIVVTEPVIAACGGSLLFDENSIGVQLPSSNQYYSGTNGGYTWECWFKLNEPFGTDQRPLISAIDGVTYEDQWLGFGWQGGWYDEPVSRLVFKVDGPNSTVPSGPNCSYAPPGGFLLDTWYHVAGVMNYTTQQAKLFVNGALVDAQTITTPPITRIIPTELSYAWSGTPLSLYGNMDEVRIWERPLSDAEVANGYLTCMSGNEQDLLVYYRCNQVAGSTVLDATANNMNGTFTDQTGWSVQEPPLSGAACVAACLEICGNGIDDNNNGQVDEGCICPAIAVSNDTTICPGGSAQLSTLPGFANYSWSPATGLSDPAIYNPVATPAVTTTYTLSADVPGPNLIVNPDISAGNVGFICDQNLNAGFIFCSYQVGPNYFITGPAYVDHTPSSDNMMISIDGCTTPTRIWEQTVYGLLPNTNYAFSFWATRAVLAQPAFEIHYIGNVSGDVIAATPIGIPNTGTWQWDQYGIPSWNSGSNTSVTIRIINQELAFEGNDFAMDDFSFNKLCTTIDSVTVSVINTIAPTLELGNDIFMCASATHTFDAGPGFKSYLWNDGGTGQTLTAYGFGTYSVTVTDSCNNTQTDVVHIYESSAPTLTITGDSVLCEGESTQLAFSTGGTFAHILWSPAAGLSCTDCNSPVLTPNTSSTYYLVASTADGCTAVDSISIIQSASPQQVTVHLPCDSINGLIEFHAVQGGEAPYQFNFNNLGFSSDSVYPGILPATYVLSIKDANGCLFDTSIVFNGNPLSPGSVTYQVSDAECEPNGTVLIQGVTGGTSPYLYNFNNGGYSALSTYSPLDSGMYLLTVKDNNDCMLDVSIHVSSISVGPSSLIIGTTPFSCEFGGTALIEVIGGTAPYLYSLNNAAFTGSAYFNNLNEASYTLMVKDANNCSVDSSFSVMALEEEEVVYIPNCFTPNTDVTNNEWFISGNCIKSVSCKIYNRWGEEIFAINNPDDKWDGSYKGKPVQDGVYFYIAEITFYSEATEHKVGSVSLFR